jgi:hypothetical protein
MTVALFEDVLNIEPIDPDKDYRSELVGEGKKYKDDAALARSRVEADRHIQRLEAEQKAMRTDLNSRLSLEELVTKLSSYKAPDPAPQGGDDNSHDTSKQPALTAEDLAKIVDERVRSISDTERAKANMTLVKNTLKQEWGDGFVDKMKQKAQDLGVGENFLNSLAMEQPNAFLKLMDVGSGKPDPTKPNTSSPLMGNQIDSSKRQAQPQVDPNYKGKVYYMKLHRENPNLFWNPKTQIEMDQMAQLDPEKFLAS